MRRISRIEQQVAEFRTEADNQKEKFESLQLEKDVLTEEKGSLEQQLNITTAKLVVLKASSNQVENKKDRLESSFVEQHSRATEEIRSLKELLNQKEVYASDLVQILTQAQGDLHTTYEKVKFLEDTLEPLKVYYEYSKAEKEDLKAEIEQLEKDNEALEDKLTLDVSWAFLNACLDTLTEACHEGFDLEGEIAKAKYAIESTQQCQSFSTPEDESSKGDLSKDGSEADQVDAHPSSSTQVNPSAPSDDALQFLSLLMIIILDDVFFFTEVSFGKLLLPNF